MKKVILAVFLNMIIFTSNAVGQISGTDDWGIGARALGMGRAFICLPDDATAVNLNPACLSDIDYRSLLTSYEQVRNSTSTVSYLSITLPFKKIGTIGISINRYMSNIGVINNIFYYKDSNSMFSIAYGKVIKENVSLGANIKHSNFNEYGINKSNIVSNDISLLLRDVANIEDLKVSVGIKNIFRTETLGSNSDLMPVSIRLGSAYKYLDKKGIISCDIEKGSDYFNWAIGTEYVLNNIFAIQVGFNGDDVIHKESSVGIGYKYRYMYFNMAYVIDGDKTSTFVSGSWNFDVFKKEYNELKKKNSNRSSR